MYYREVANKAIDKIAIDHKKLTDYQQSMLRKKFVIIRELIDGYLAINKLKKK